MHICLLPLRYWPAPVPLVMLFWEPVTCAWHMFPFFLGFLRHKQTKRMMTFRSTLYSLLNFTFPCSFCRHQGVWWIQIHSTTYQYLSVKRSHWRWNHLYVILTLSDIFIPSRHQTFPWGHDFLCPGQNGKECLPPIVICLDSSIEQYPWNKKTKNLNNTRVLVLPTSFKLFHCKLIRPMKSLTLKCNPLIPSNI